VGNYQQSDSLSTVTDLPMSGTGTSTPETPAADADYSAWRWEVVLATVLDVGIPDRTEVTGQPWLTIGHDGQGGTGAHLIWTADWQAGQTSAGKSLQVYLNPALYTAGGAWDRFFNAPAQALAGVPNGNYGGLPLVPPTFTAASSEIATVTSWIQSASDQFDKMHNDAISGPIAGFQGNLAGVVGELLESLHTVMLNVHDQMTYPTSYSDSITAAGNSATTFLTDVLSAHSSWAQLTEHSPLGAVVKVLEGIATPDASGNYVIADPQNTPFGDLTVDGSWAAVEQQAKNLWTGTLIGGSPDFTGLDLLGRTALGTMVSQFGLTTSTIVPVVAPGQTPPQSNPVNPNHVDATHTPNSGNTGGGGPNQPNDVLLSGGPNGPGNPASPQPNPSADFVLPGTGNPNGGPASIPVAASVLGPGSVNPANLSVRPNGPGPMPVSLVATGLAGPPPNGTAAPAPAGLDRFDALAVPPGVALGSPSGTGTAPPAGRGLLGFPEPGADPIGFTGTIGSPNAGEPGATDPRGDRNKHAGRDKKVLATMPTAPSAGFSLGSDPGGAVLKRAAVPMFAAKPPAVTSGFVNLQPVPGQGGPTPTGEGTPTLVTDGGVIGRGMTTAGEPDGAGGFGAPDEPGLLPMGTGGAGGGLGRPERERLAYLPEEAEYWGTRPELATSSLQAAARQTPDEPDFEPRQSRVSAIGAQAEFTPGKHAVSDRRTR
jgi:hypothetical protein